MKVIDKNRPLRIAAFGFRTIPFSPGSAGADKFAMELFPRLVQRGHSVIAYNRRYPDVYIPIDNYKGIKIKTFRTVRKKGFDTFLHSLKCTVDIIFNNTAKIVHIQNGGNSIWSIPLRIFGKKVFISQDGIDWKRNKWPWYGKLYLRFSAWLSAYLPNEVIFDNIIAKNYFEKRFNKKFTFIPFGSEIDKVSEDDSIFEKLALDKHEYYLFVGRIIPDKGLHYLIPALMNSESKRKLLIIGGAPNPSPYEGRLRSIAGPNVIFAGFIYGEDVTRLMLNCYCYIQPSDVEGLSPVVLTVMGLGVPLVVSDIEENKYAVEDTAIQFHKSDIPSLTEKINYAESNYPAMKEMAKKAQARALTVFNWDKVAEDHEKVFYSF